MDKQKVHVWQLPEKKNSLDKNNNIMMIHDGILLKKIVLNQLYEYINQDYKIDNIVQYFNDILDNLSKQYDPQYESCEEFLLNYEKIVRELQRKFKENENKIRNLEKRQNTLEINITNINTSFSNIQDKFDILYETINNFKLKVYELKDQSSKDTNSIKTLNKDILNLSEVASQLYINSGSMKDQISNIRKNQEKDLQNREDIFIKRLEDEYDKILAIIDHYHHIHTDTNIYPKN